MKRERADVLLVQQGLVGSRERARAAILAGEVTADGDVVRKAGQQISIGARLSVTAGPAYVSRGGVKLAHALDAFGVDARERTAIDVGASTGGFTDCLLQRGAAGVVAIDVGYGQLAWKLRNDPRVVVMERTNVRHLDPGSVEMKADILTVDVSFISIHKILDRLVPLLADNGVFLALVKPQFEGERRDVGKGGVVRDPAAHRRILLLAARRVKDAGLAVRGVAYSPITGADGNIEFWLCAGKRAPDEGLESRIEDSVGEIVDEAHRVLASGRDSG